MKWPLMSRATHDAILAVHADTIATLRADLAACRERHEAFVLRVADRAVPPAKTPVERPPAREQDEVDTAIEWKAQGDAGIRRYLAAYARAERRKGVDPKELAERILKGEGASDDDGVPEA